MRQCSQCESKFETNVPFYELYIDIKRKQNGSIISEREEGRHCANEISKEEIEFCTPDCVQKFIGKILSGLIARKDN